MNMTLLHFLPQIQNIKSASQKRNHDPVFYNNNNPLTSPKSQISQIGNDSNNNRISKWNKPHKI